MYVEWSAPERKRDEEPAAASPEPYFFAGLHA
jgi:hypothetical protein